MVKEEDKLTDREFAIEGYGTDYKGVLPDGTVTGIMSYDGKVFKHYVETGEGMWGHQFWERDYEGTPLRTALELLAVGESASAMKTDEVSYRGTFYESSEMESVGLSGWRYDYHDKKRFKRLVLSGEINLPAPAVFSQYGNIYIEEGYAEEVENIYWSWIEGTGSQSTPKTKEAGV